MVNKLSYVTLQITFHSAPKWSDEEGLKLHSISPLGNLFPKPSLNFLEITNLFISSNVDWAPSWNLYHKLSKVSHMDLFLIEVSWKVKKISETSSKFTAFTLRRTKRHKYDFRTLNFFKGDIVIANGLHRY